MRTEPIISVIMPLHEGAEFFDKALSSLPDDPQGLLEIIAFDSSADPACAQIALRHAGRLTIMYEHRPDIVSWTTKTNQAAARARGTHIVMLHQDDFWLPNRMSVMLRSVEAAPDATLILTAAAIVNDADQIMGIWRCPLGQRPVWQGADVVKRLLVQNFIALPSAIISKTAWRTIGGLDESLWYTPDWDFFIKAAVLGNVAYVPEPTVAFRIHGASQTMTGSRSAEAFHAQMDTVLRRHSHILSHEDNSRIMPVATASARINTLLAQAVHGRKAAMLGAFWELLRLGPSNWHRYFRDSRLTERIVPRVRARLKSA